MQSVFELVIVVSSLAGLMSASRLATLLVRSRVVSALEMTEIVTGSLAITVLAFFWCSPVDFSTGKIHLFAFWFVLQGPIAMGVAIAFLLAKRRDQAVEDSLDDIISRLIMRIKEGRSLAVALEEVATQSPRKQRPRWLEIARSVSFSPQNSDSKTISDALNELRSLRLVEIAREFRRIDGLNRSQLLELERWRQRIRTERIFRRRSVQAMAQVRAQSIVLATIYALLAMFSVTAFGWRATVGPFQISFPLFLIGFFFIWRGGRRVKWSV